MLAKNGQEAVAADARRSTPSEYLTNPIKPAALSAALAYVGDDRDVLDEFLENSQGCDSVMRAEEQYAAKTDGVLLVMDAVEAKIVRGSSTREMVAVGGIEPPTRGL